ncbi:MAG: hypothetical protein RSG53_09635 [Oscillospiraceae bacterium]
MDDSQSRSEQLEELLKELRQKRLAQTMELEQIKAEYLNDPSKPIQSISSILPNRSGVSSVQKGNSDTQPRQPQNPSFTPQRVVPPNSGVKPSGTNTQYTSLQISEQREQEQKLLAAERARREAQISQQQFSEKNKKSANISGNQNISTAANQARSEDERIKQAELRRQQLLSSQRQQKSVDTNRSAAKQRPIMETIQFDIPKDQKPAFTTFANAEQTPDNYTESKKSVIEKDSSEESLHQRHTSTHDKRSILGNLVSENPESDSFQFDPINKDMLAPTIERGVDVIPTDLNQINRNTKDILIPEQKREYTENHPLFTQNFTTENLIPEEQRSSSKRRPSSSGAQSNNEHTMSSAIHTKSNEKKGVLNVKENVDDNFREFFGDTVIIDRESLNDKAKRQRKIKDFVLADKEGEVGGPVFEDEEEIEQDNAVEYRSDEDTEHVLNQLTSDKSKSLVKTITAGAVAFVLLILNIMAEFEILPDFISQPLTFYALNLLLLLIPIGMCARAIFVGFGRLVTFKADENSVIAFSCIASLVESAVLMFTAKDDAVSGACACVAAAALFFNQLGVLLKNMRILYSFRTVSESYEKYSSAVLDDQNFTRRLARELEISSPTVLIKRKTGFTDNFIPHSYSSANVDKGVSLMASIVLFLSILCGAVGLFKTSEISSLVRFMALSAAFMAPFVSTLASSLPIYCMQRFLSKFGAVMPGYSAADEICNANCVVLEGRELFPKGNVLLHGIKTFERERIDKAILYAASVIVQSCDTMSHMFMNVIQNKTEMLYQVDSVEYEGGLGYSFWIDKTRILLGTRELLKAHEIEPPSLDYENRYTKTSSRDALYLAVAGKLYAMFVISYAPNAEVESALKSFEREGVSILVHTRDFNITPEKITRLYHIPQNMVSVVHEGDIADLTKKTEYVGHSPSALTHIGSLTSFVKGIIACYNVRSSVKMSTAIELACMILGTVVAVVLSLMGLITTIGVVSVLLFQVICCLLMSIVVSAHRY